ncbi:MAG: hypothetical protein B6D46_11075 [Polyangiaceae bacterium UTPRO1]|nr:MAG: hypothetical protein B6D46_11075 [Polyangiaceae bacterium UTPRO1]
MTRARELVSRAVQVATPARSRKPSAAGPARRRAHIGARSKPAADALAASAATAVGRPVGADAASAGARRSRGAFWQAPACSAAPTTQHRCTSLPSSENGNGKRFPYPTTRRGRCRTRGGSPTRHGCYSRATSPSTNHGDEHDRDAIRSTCGTPVAAGDGLSGARGGVHADGAAIRGRGPLDRAAARRLRDELHAGDAADPLGEDRRRASRPTCRVHDRRPGLRQTGRLPDVLPRCLRLQRARADRPAPTGGAVTPRGPRTAARSGLAAALVMLAACAQTAVQPQGPTVTTRLGRPARVLVYDLATSPGEIHPDQGVLHQVANAATGMQASERDAALGDQAQNAFSTELVSRINAMGLRAERASVGTGAAPGDVKIVGAFLDIDQGNQLRRLVIGLGAGASEIDAEIEVLQATAAKPVRVAQFSTHADSGEMPGAALTMGAGAAATGGVSVGLAAANVAVSGAKAFRSQIEQMAGRSADKAADYLARVFAQQGWITTQP